MVKNYIDEDIFTEELDKRATALFNEHKTLSVSVNDDLISLTDHEKVIACYQNELKQLKTAIDNFPLYNQLKPMLQHYKANDLVLFTKPKRSITKNELLQFTLANYPHIKIDYTDLGAIDET